MANLMLILAGLGAGLWALKAFLAWPPIATILYILGVVATVLGIVIITVSVLASRLISGGRSRWA